MTGLRIAIDGPAGSGKTTVGLKLARRLDLPFLDSGVLYRVLAWRAGQLGVDPGNARALADLARRTEVEVDLRDPARVSVDGEPVTDDLHDPALSLSVSRIAGVGEVRAALLDRQRELARDGIVMAGRDIGSVVLPDADIKFFITAGVEERMRRRGDELSRRGEAVSRDRLRAEIEERDRQDESREVAPLRVAAGARVVDTEGRSVDQVVDQLEGWVRGC
ncbi:MAG: (d)CMP kinase [Candidatus Dormibacteria bacterium]